MGQPEAETAAQPKPDKAPKPTVKAPAKPKPVKEPKVKIDKNSPAFPPLESPPVPLSADKQQRLDALLVKYKADQLTPEQYHQQRAKILAEP